MFIQVDGMTFNSDKSILYAAKNGINVGTRYNVILAVSSSDDWATMDLLYVFPAACTLGFPSAVVFGGNTLFVNCGFGPGPYDIHFLDNADMAITDGNSIYGEEDSKTITKNDDDGDDGLAEMLQIVVIVLAVVCVVLIAALVVTLIRVSRQGKDTPLLTQSSSQIPGRNYA